MPHVKLLPAMRNWKEIPSAGSYRVVVAPLRLQHTAVWLGRRSAHAWESPTARPYPKRSLGSTPVVEAFAAAPTSSAPEQSAAPEARTAHARKRPAARYVAAVALASHACTALPCRPQHRMPADALVSTKDETSLDPLSGSAPAMDPPREGGRPPWI